MYVACYIVIVNYDNISLQKRHRNIDGIYKYRYKGYEHE